MAHVIPFEAIEEIVRDIDVGAVPRGFYFMNAFGEKLSAKKVRKNWWHICEARRDPLYDHEWLIVGAGLEIK